MKRNERQRLIGRQTISRRGFLCLASTLVAVHTSRQAGWLADAFAAEAEQSSLPLLKMPSVTRNGAHVPIAAEMHHPMEPDHYLTTLQILNDSDPIPSKGTFHLSPTSGLAYLSVQARMHSGTSTVRVIAECSRHGRWTSSQSITIPEGGGGCATAAEEADDALHDDTIRPPVIRIPELVERGTIRRGEIIRVQVKLKHPSRTGLSLEGGKFLQTAEPFYVKEMKVLYADRLVSRYEMTPAISENPFITFTLRATEASTIRIVLTNSRSQQFQADQPIVFS